MSDPSSITGTVLTTPKDGSVTTAKLVDGSVSAEKLNGNVIHSQTALATTIADADELLLDDGAGGTLRRATRGVFLVQPWFRGYLSSDDAITDSTWELICFTAVDATYTGWHAGNDYYTIPADLGGKWLLEGAAYVQVDAQPAGIYSAIDIDGTLHAVDNKYVTYNSYVVLQSKIIVSLSAGTKVGYKLYLPAANTTSLALAAYGISSISGVRVSS